MRWRFWRQTPAQVCAWRGHMPKISDRVNVGDGATWVQETCLRCKQRRRYVVRPGRLDDRVPTPWA
jgi:hypothetical protein